MRFARLLTTVVLALLSITTPAGAQDVGDRVVAVSTNPQGVPVHPAPGNNSFVRWANGTIGTVDQIDAPTGWLRVTSLGDTGWIVPRYLTVLADEDEPTPDGDEQPTLIVGTWNLEHFSSAATRGFPENTHGGPTYPPHTDADLEQIAHIIQTELFADILILNEINGRPNETTSAELDDLLTHMGTGWTYALTRAGNDMRIAILYNEGRVQRETCVELTVPDQEVQGKDVFERDPLVCHFTALDNGMDQNDLLVVGLHLASGQDLNQNHNQAMTILRDRLATALTDNTLSAGETDILIGGDLNANRYDTRQEDFWEGPATGTIHLHALSPENGEDYEATRLSGVPLLPRNSKIDYLLIQDDASGIGADLVQQTAHIHTELLTMGTDAYREAISDHLPVTIRIRITADDD